MPMDGGGERAALAQTPVVAAAAPGAVLPAKGQSGRGGVDPGR